MTTLLATFLILLIVMAGMAVGVMFGRAPIKGSCGGINQINGGSGSCDLCGGSPSKCEDQAAGRA